MLQLTVMMLNCTSSSSTSSSPVSSWVYKYTWRGRRVYTAVCWLDACSADPRHRTQPSPAALMSVCLSLSVCVYCATISTTAQKQACCCWILLTTKTQRGYGNFYTLQSLLPSLGFSGHDCRMEQRRPPYFHGPAAGKRSRVRPRKGGLTSSRKTAVNIDLEKAVRAEEGGQIHAQRLPENLTSRRHWRRRW